MVAAARRYRLSVDSHHRMIEVGVLLPDGRIDILGGARRNAVMGVRRHALLRLLDNQAHRFERVGARTGPAAPRDVLVRPVPSTPSLRFSLLRTPAQFASR